MIKTAINNGTVTFTPTGSGSDVTVNVKESSAFAMALYQGN